MKASAIIATSGDAPIFCQSSCRIYAISNVYSICRSIQITLFNQNLKTGVSVRYSQFSFATEIQKDKKKKLKTISTESGIFEYKCIRFN